MICKNHTNAEMLKWTDNLGKCVLFNTTRKGYSGELYQIENTLQDQGGVLQMQVCIIDNLTSRDGLDLKNGVSYSSSTGEKTSPQLLHRYPLSGFDSIKGKSIPQQIGHGSSISISACSISPERFSNSTITSILLLFNNRNARIDVPQGYVTAN